MHATTKYIGGHSDVLGGAVVFAANDAFAERVRFLQINGGAVPSPFDCWLALRGIQTLPYRVRAHAANAMQVARFLAEHPRIERVHYPGLETHPDHAVLRGRCVVSAACSQLKSKAVKRRRWRLQPG